jgi:2-aminoadipate transaminase
MPTYQNPTGRSLSADKRRQLLRLAAAYDLPVVEDDSAGFYPLEPNESASPSLKAEDHAGNVIHLGTFSKLVAAGVRLGWLVASSPALEKLTAAKYASDLSSDALMQRAMHRLLASGALGRHLAAARAEYRQRRNVLAAALSQPGVLPPGATFEAPSGGFNLWLELPLDGPSSTDLYLEAVRRGVAFVPGPFFFAAGGTTSVASAARGLRLCYSSLPVAAIDQGVRLLADAWRGSSGAAQTPPPPAVVY